MLLLCMLSLLPSAAPAHGQPYNMRPPHRVAGHAVATLTLNAAATTTTTSSSISIRSSRSSTINALGALQSGPLAEDCTRRHRPAAGR